MADRRAGSISQSHVSYLIAFTLAALAAPMGCVPVGPATDNGDNGGDTTNGDGGEPVAGLPLADFTTVNFTGSGRCAVCHSDLIDTTGDDVSIVNDWRATMMANAAKDPFFLASVSAEVAHAPGLKETIEDVCAKCHMPMARTQAVADGAASLIFDEGFLSPENSLNAAAMDGVSCSVCHQIQDTFLADPEASFSGGFDIDTEGADPDRPIFGPFPAPQQPELMRGAVGYTPTFGDHITRSGLCATCHTLFTPTLDAAGQPTGEMFPEQTPFLEWQHSAFGDNAGDDDRQCQDCHMPLADAPVVISSLGTSLSPREPFYRHEFLGGNVFMLRLLRNNIEALGLTASSEQFDSAIARTESYLQNQTATLDITAAEIGGATLSIMVRVANLTGHKFPTSFPSRRAWVHLTVDNGAGLTLFDSGSWLDDGRIIGDDGDTSPESFERHHDVINSDDQVQVYQAIMQDTDAQVTYTLLRGAAYGKDNRLLPTGFNKSSADAEIAVYGRAAGDDDFIGGSDLVAYQVNVASQNGPFTATAELLYQSLSFRFVEHLNETNTLPVETFGDLYDAADKTPTVVDSDQRVVP